MKIKIFAVLCGLLVAGLANAECPSSMSEAEMMKCQEIEKSGASYQEYMSQESTESTKSPITGEDVTKMAPAAGGDKAESNAAK